jgi:hypothetical protein
MKILSADEMERYELDFFEGTLRCVDDGSFRVTMLISKDEKYTVVVSIKEV